MFLIPVLILVVVGVVVYRVVHRQPHAVASGSGDTVAVPQHPVWPTTVTGWLGLAAFGLTFLPIALVNVVQVAFLGWALMLGSLVFTGVARFAQHDRSTSVLVVFVVSAIAATFAVLFLAGEVFIGHD